MPLVKKYIMDGVARFINYSISLEDLQSISFIGEEAGHTLYAAIAVIIAPLTRIWSRFKTYVNGQGEWGLKFISFWG